MSEQRVPALVELLPNEGGGWLDIDGAFWVTRNVLDASVPLDQVRTAHFTPDGESCKHSGARLGLHERVSVEPLTLRASLACDACAVHGFVRDGKWVPA